MLGPDSPSYTAVRHRDLGVGGAKETRRTIRGVKRCTRYDASGSDADIRNGGGAVESARAVSGHRELKLS